MRTRFAAFPPRSHIDTRLGRAQDWGEAPELSAWVKRQRVARAQGALTDERLQILRGMGFEFGEVAQMTDEWERRFDQLLDWLLWSDERGARVSWLAGDWGARYARASRLCSIAGWAWRRGGCGSCFLLAPARKLALHTCVLCCPVCVRTPSLAAEKGDCVLKVIESLFTLPTHSLLSGGVTARQLSLWVQLQREFKRRNLLGAESVKRLEAIGFQWEPREDGERQQGGASAATSADFHKQSRWLARLGRLLYAIERVRGGDAGGSGSSAGAASASAVLASGGGRSGAQGLRQAQPGAGTGAAGSCAAILPAGSGQFGGGKDSAASTPAARGMGRRYLLEAQLQQDIASRRAALVGARLEPGMSYWLARQRWLWRRGALTQEQALMLELAGVQLDIYTLPEWRVMAHTAAHYLLSSNFGPPPADAAPRPVRAMFG